MADLPASTIAVVQNNSGTLSETVLSYFTHLTSGTSLTPLMWILLTELLLLGIGGSLYAIRLVRLRRKQIISAVSQMIELYTRGKDTRRELRQQQIEDLFHFSPEKAAQASLQLLENEQAFLSSLTHTLSHWDMRRLSRIHIEFGQFNEEQLIALASMLKPSTSVDAPQDNKTENDGVTSLENPGLGNEDIDLVIPDSNEMELLFGEEEHDDQPEDMMLMLDDDIENVMDKSPQKITGDSGALVLDLPEDEQGGFNRRDRLSQSVTEPPASKS
ncbi:hypothetical protein F6R98_15615 [Candidatus Methylospira mobilis]|uniref:Uncharacterized protein n=1 Tax=Candidatus Methylospira mobilis TaxID=1808979 RepID=A0A5Q0BK05_9GAMM|nr:hypothetical protein [Candidatus Methylospira mobilis]QFY43879.1 hypothetical protein F6R98_15615 [Candidatus Methylospira mobilis]WNV04881.1 hypothetical protein RP726_00330 [Candidatus Methylospira mobilis]